MCNSKHFNILFIYMTEQTPMVINQERVGSIFLDDPLIIQDDVGNVLSSGLRSTSRLTPSGIGLLNDSLGADTLSGVALNAVGLAYSNLTETKTATWENITTKIEAIAAISQASNATTLNINNTLQVQNGETINIPTPYVSLTADGVGTRLSLSGDAGSNGYVLTSGGSAGSLSWAEGGGGGSWVGTAESNLDMVTYDITSSTGTLNLDATNIEITGQANFVSPPHIPEPILGNDAASKGYVDSLVGQYSGGFNLFLNYSETSPYDPAYKVLSQLVSSAVQQTVNTNITDANPVVISQFLTDPIGITTLPQGIWDLLLYASVDITQDSTTTYFELWKMGEDGAVGTIGTSGISPDINASPNNNPTAYSMSLTVPFPVAFNLTDKLFIRVYGQTTHNTTVILRSFYEGNYYSFIQTPLNAGTTLLSSNNNWTGTNNFALNPTTPTKLSPANTDIINYGDIVNYVNNDPIVSTSNIFLTSINAAFQYPPAVPPSAIINTYQYYGWYFINAVALRKIDWYFPPSKNMLVSDILGLYMNFFNITTTDPQNLPFISVYTVPTGSGDAIPGFAHSVMTYSLYDGLPINPFLPTANTAYCAFMDKSGSQPTPFAYGATVQNMLISPVPNNPRGQYLPSETVAYISVGTNSTSPVNQVNFVMSKVGICLADGNQENILIPQNLLSPVVPTLTQVLTNGNAAGSQSITGVNNLSATSLTTPTLANGAATLTVGTVGQITNIVGTLQNNGAGLASYISGSGVASGAIDMNTNAITNCPRLDSASALALGGTSALGATLGRSTQTTNLLGNLQVNSLSGTSGQYLKSNGSGTVPTWANPTLLVSAPAQSTPNAGITIPYQLFTSTVISGITGEYYLFTFRINLTSATITESPEIAMTLATSVGNVTPTTSNSFNVTTPASTILAVRPDELTSLCISKHYGAISGRQDQTMNFTYLYQFASTATITFSVWSWGNGTTGVYNRKNVSLNYVRLNA